MYKAEYVSVESGPEVHTSHSLLKVDYLRMGVVCWLDAALETPPLTT